MQKRMDQLTFENVLIAMVKILAHYPDSTLNGEMVKMLAEDYYEAFIEEKVTKPSFDWAVKDVKKRCLFYPKIPDFLESVKVYRSRPPQENKKANAIAHDERRDWTKEELAINKQKISILMDQAMGKISEHEATEKIKELEKQIMEFKNDVEIVTKEKK